MVDLVNINTNDSDSIKYIIKFLRGKTMIVSKEFLKSRDVPEFWSTQISSYDYINEPDNTTQENVYPVHNWQFIFDPFWLRQISLSNIYIIDNVFALVLPSILPGANFSSEVQVKFLSVET